MLCSAGCISCEPLVSTVVRALVAGVNTQVGDLCCFYQDFACDYGWCGHLGARIFSISGPDIPDITIRSHHIDDETLDKKIRGYFLFHRICSKVSVRSRGMSY